MRKVFVIAATVVLVSCGSSNSSSGTTASTASTVTDTVADSVPESPTQNLTLTVGLNTGANVILEVEQNATVVLTAMNPSSHDEIHLHGYDLTTGSIERGQEAIITFTAITTGDFEIESHETGQLLATLRVIAP